MFSMFRRKNENLVGIGFEIGHCYQRRGKITEQNITFLMKKSEVAQSCPTLRSLMDCSLPGSSVHGVFQTRILQ